MISKRLIFAVAGSATVFAHPMPTHPSLDGLSPEQIKAGCTLNMLPPFRPECQAAAGKQHAVHAGAAPVPNPDIDVGCEFNGHIIPDCHLTIGHHSPKLGPIYVHGDLPLPSEGGFIDDITSDRFTLESFWKLDEPRCPFSSIHLGSAGEIADALLKAGVPADAVSSAAEAVSHSVNAAPKGWIGRPTYNAALAVISSAATSAGVAAAEAAEAAKAAVKGATGPGLAWSFGPAGVPAAAADATAEAMTEAIQAVVASGSEPVVAAINFISKAASPAGLAAAAAFEGASGSSLAPALSAAGVPTESLGATSDAVADAVSANRGSTSAAMNAAADVIASAASLAYERKSSPAPPVFPAQAALVVVGASFQLLAH